MWSLTLIISAANLHAATTLPANFIESQIATGILSPISMTFAPDGRLFICEQYGTIRIVKNGALLSTPFTTMNVNTTGDQGVLAIAFDPNFGTGTGQNQYIYIHYTVKSSTPFNRISRFTA